MSANQQRWLSSTAEKNWSRKRRSGSLPSPQKPSRNIILLIIDKGLGCFRTGDLDLFTDSLHAYDSEAAKYGYSLRMKFIRSREEYSQCLTECNAPETAGILIMATELSGEDLPLIRQIRKPILIYDNDFGSSYDCITIDNYQAASDAVDCLVQRRCRKIHYLAYSTRFYNMLEREKGFRHGLRENALSEEECRVIYAGSNITSAQKKMEEEIHGLRGNLPDAYLCEGYVTSTAVVQTLLKEGYKIPDDVSVIGIDMIPDYLTAGIHVTSFHTAHEDRASLGMILLAKTIDNQNHDPFVVRSRCRMVPGTSVK